VPVNAAPSAANGAVPGNAQASAPGPAPVGPTPVYNPNDAAGYAQPQPGYAEPQDNRTPAGGGVIAAGLVLGFFLSWIGILIQWGVQKNKHIKYLRWSIIGAVVGLVVWSLLSFFLILPMEQKLIFGTTNAYTSTPYRSSSSTSSSKSSSGTNSQSYANQDYSSMYNSGSMKGDISIYAQAVSAKWDDMSDNDINSSSGSIDAATNDVLTMRDYTESLLNKYPNPTTNAQQEAVSTLNDLEEDFTNIALDFQDEDSETSADDDDSLETDLSSFETDLDTLGTIASSM
jgi:uncharacterized membrane protein YeaQ/YmgE (transglycosylase-associated protein family)